MIEIASIGLLLGLVFFFGLRYALQKPTKTDIRAEMHHCCGLEAQLGRRAGSWNDKMYMCRSCWDRYQSMMDS